MDPAAAGNFGRRSKTSEMDPETSFVPSARVTARQHLRSSTNDLHEQLHALPPFVKLMDNSLDVPGYVAILRRFRDFYALMDVQMLQACSDCNIPDTLYHYQPRQPMFAADVRALGGDSHAAVHDSCPWPDMDSAASLAGVAYVIDGSVLGGITMNKSAMALLGEGVTSGRSYWNWCRKNGLRQWHSALALVDSRWTDAKSRTAMTNAALRTFEALNVWHSADGENAGVTAS